MIRTVFGYGYAFAGEATTESDAHAASVYYLFHGTMQHRLLEGENIIGRDSEATVVIDALGISRRHAIITVHAARMSLEDLGSKNGTFLNGKRIRGRVPLGNGAEVRLGLLKAHVRALSSDGTTVTEI